MQSSHPASGFKSIYTHTQSFTNTKQTMSNTWPNETKLGRKGKKRERVFILKDVDNVKLTSLDYKDGEKFMYIVDSLHHY